MVGISFDLLGGYLVARGLLASPLDIARRNFDPFHHEFNVAEAISQLRDLADGRMGLISLGIGFALQAIGYVAVVAGVGIATGGEQAVASVLLATGLGLGAFVLCRRRREGVVRRLVVDLARADPMTGHVDDYPDRERLIELGRGLGFAPVIGPGEDFRERHLAFARAVFGVERLSERSRPPSRSLLAPRWPLARSNARGTKSAGG